MTLARSAITVATGLVLSACAFPFKATQPYGVNNVIVRQDSAYVVEVHNLSSCFANVLFMPAVSGHITRAAVQLGHVAPHSKQLVPISPNRDGRVSAHRTNMDSDDTTCLRSLAGRVELRVVERTPRS